MAEILDRCMDGVKPAGYRAFGTTEDITDCWHCGKAGLKKTVKMRFLDEDGGEYGETYIGSTCAARLLAGRADAGLATRIMREAEAADRRRAEAVANSARFFAYYGLYIARQEDPQERGDRGAYIREYTRCNRTGEDARFAEIALEALARHREVVATGGESAL